MKNALIVINHSSTTCSETLQAFKNLRKKYKYICQQSKIIITVVKALQVLLSLLKLGFFFHEFESFKP